MGEDFTLLNQIRLLLAEIAQSVAAGELTGKDAANYKAQCEVLIPAIDKTIGDV